MFFTIPLKHIISPFLIPLVYYLFIRFIQCLPPKGSRQHTINSSIKKKKKTLNSFTNRKQGSRERRGGRDVNVDRKREETWVW